MALPWKNIGDIDDLDFITQESYEAPVIIYKHSTRCSISSMAKSRLESNLPIADEQYYFLDLLSHRDISDKIAAIFHVQHESPQILLIKKGRCVYNNSHSGISFSELQAKL